MLTAGVGTDLITAILGNDVPSWIGLLTGGYPYTEIEGIGYRRMRCGPWKPAGATREFQFFEALALEFGPAVGRWDPVRNAGIYSEPAGRTHPVAIDVVDTVLVALDGDVLELLPKLRIRSVDPSPRDNESLAK